MGPPAFTMVELLIGLSLAVLLTAAMLLSYTFLVRNLIRSSNQQQLEAQSSRFFQMLGKDVHSTTNVSAYSASSVALVMPNLSTVTYNYNALAGTLTRTDPTGSLTLITGVSIFSFNFLDGQGVALPSPPPSSPYGIKQIEVNALTATSGTATVGTQSSFAGTSARWVLRNQHLVN